MRQLHRLARIAHRYRLQRLVVGSRHIYHDKQPNASDTDLRFLSKPGSRWWHSPRFHLDRFSSIQLHVYQHMYVSRILFQVSGTPGKHQC